MNTKRILALVLALCVVFSLALPGVSFADDPSPSEPVTEGTTEGTTEGVVSGAGEVYYTVSFDANGGVETYETQSVKAGDKAVKPSDPTQDGFTFDAWYEATRDEGNGEVYYSKYDFEQPVNDNLELVALWNSNIPEEELNVVLTKQVRSLSLGNPVLTNNQSQDNNVAEVYNGETLIGSYSTLAEAIAATQNGYTVKLLANCETGSNYSITNPLVLSANNAKLDLNGKTLTVTSNFSFLISGDNDEVYGGTINAGANTQKATGINSYALVVNGCNGVRLNGLTVNGGISIGGSTGETPDAAAATNVTIENCTVISGDYYAVCAQQNSTVTIKSGTYTADTRSTYSGVIQGTFVGNDGPKGTVTVTGGTFNGNIVNNDIGDIVLSGGTFDHDPSAYVADGYVATQSGNVWTVSGAVAKIGTTKYATLAEAIAAAQAEDTIEILADIELSEVLLLNKSVTIDGKGHELKNSATRIIRITQPNLTVSLKDWTLTSTCTATSDVRGISFDAASAGSKLYLDRCTVSASFYTINAVLGADNLTISIKNGTVAAGWAALNLYSNNSSIVIDNSTLRGLNDKGESSWNNFNTITFDGYCLNGGEPGTYGSNNTVTITNSTVESSSNSENKQYWIGIQYGAKGNKVTVDSATQIKDSAENDQTLNCLLGWYYNSSSWSYYDSENVITVGGSVIMAGAGATITVPEVTGGYYDLISETYFTAGEHTLGSYVDEDAEPYAILVPTNLVGDIEATVDGTDYLTLEDAVAAANESGNCTITIQKDIDFSQAPYDEYKWAGSTYNPLTITASGVTIDLNNHKLYNMGNCALVFGNILANDGRLASAEIKNGRLEAGTTNNVKNSYVLGIAGVDSAKISNVTTDGGINVYTGSNVAVENCTVNGTKYYALCTQTGSTATITGSTFTKNTDSSVATKAMFWVDKAGTDSDCITDQNPTGAYGASSISIASGTFTLSNDGVFHLKSGLKPVATGGTYNFDAKDYAAEGYDAVDNSNGTWTVQPHTHTFDHTKPNWSWKVVNGVWSATVSYPCVKNDAVDTVEAVVTAGTPSGGSVTYTAVDPDRTNNYATKTVVLTYTVTYDGNNTTFKYGEAFKAGEESGSVLYDWYVMEDGKTYDTEHPYGDLRAKGTSVFYLPVVAKATVTKQESASGTTTQEPVANSSATATVESGATTGTVVYHVTWSLPEGAQITSEKIYRAVSTIGKTGITKDTVIEKGAQHDVNLNVRNGDYTLTLQNVKANKDMHLVLVIKYTLPDVSEIQTLTDYTVVTVQ